MKNPTWCRRRSAEIGTACAAVIGGMLEVGVLYWLRAAQGVLGLADKHGNQRLESACSEAIAVGDREGVVVAAASVTCESSTE